jgi:hypothetical protein
MTVAWDLSAQPAFVGSRSCPTNHRKSFLISRRAPGKDGSVNSENFIVKPAVAKASATEAFHNIGAMPNDFPDQLRLKIFNH